MHRYLGVTLGISALALPLLWGTAHARSVPFLSGHTIDSEKLTCITPDLNQGTVFKLTGPFSLQNGQCGFGLGYELPLAVDNGGNKVVTYTVQAFGSPQCRAVAAARDQSMQSASPFASPTALRTFRNVALAAVTVPTSGYLFLDCDITDGDTFSVANYAP